MITRLILLAKNDADLIPERHRAEFWREVVFFNIKRIRPFLFFLVVVYPALICVVNILNVLQLPDNDRLLVFVMHLLLLVEALVLLVFLYVRPLYSPDDVVRYHEALLKFFAIGKVLSDVVFMIIITITKGHPVFFYLATIVWFSSLLLLTPRTSALLLTGMLGAFIGVLLVFSPTVANRSFVMEGYFGSVGITLMLMISSAILFRRTAEEFCQRKAVEEERNTVATLNAELSAAYEEADALNKELTLRQDLLETQAVEIEIINTSLQELNVDLTIANTELDEANRFKTQMLSIAAHDLKNPLSAIIGLAEIASYDIPPDNAAYPVLRQVQTTAERMNKLIKDLLDSAAMELGNIVLHKHELSLSMLVIGIAERYQYAAAAKHQHIELAVPEDITLFADYDRLAQVFDNLISNAVKYSPQSKTIVVRLMQRDTVARVEIQDEGQGLSAEDQSKLFGFFQRLSVQPTGDESSNGVGLAIAKKIVDLHGGRIWCESEPGQGATFIVELIK